MEPADAEIWWLYNGQALHSDATLGIHILDGSLRIESFTVSKDKNGPSHAGIYQCVASNQLGTVLSKEALLDKACE